MITKEKPTMSVQFAFGKAVGMGFEQAIERVTHDSRDAAQAILVVNARSSSR